MEAFFATVSAGTLSTLEHFINDWVVYLAIGIFVIELLKYLYLGKMSWRLVGDSGTNLLTQAAYIFISYTVFYSLYGAVFYSAHEFALFEIETTWASVIICIILADLTYYWGHRFTHRVGMAWATHEVHHSSPNFNMSVAYRFGPLDDVWAILFDVWLVVIGFDPLVAFFCSLFVLQYQTFLHTEIVKKLPRPVEFVMNTPSHHRVHHGSNPEYLDKNYGGMFIIWDRLFGTFAEERSSVVYGLTRQIGTINPIIVFLHGHYDLVCNIVKTPGLANKLRRLVMPPGWEPPATSQPAHSAPTD